MSRILTTSEKLSRADTRRALRERTKFDKQLAEEREIILRDNRAVADAASQLMFTGATKTFDPKAIAEAERQNVNLATAVRIIADSIAELPIGVAEQVMADDGKVELIPNPEHDVLELLRNPNPMHDLTHTIKHMVQSTLLTGNSFHGLEKLPRQENIAEMFPLETWKMRIIPDEKTGMPKRYEYGEVMQNVKYMPEELIHIQLYNLNDPFWGRPRIEPARRQVLSDHHMDVSNETFFKDGASIDSVFAPTGEMTDDQIQKMKQAISEKHRGFEKSHGMFIPPVPGKLYSFGASMKEMQFNEGLRMNREKIFAMMGIPPFLGGVMEYANYANALVQESSFWRHTIKPILRVVGNAISRQLILRHYGDDNMILTFDMSGVEALQQDDIQKAKKYHILIAGGIYTKNEARAEGYGLEPLEGGDELSIDSDSSVPVPVQTKEVSDNNHYKLTEVDALAYWRNFEVKAFSGEATFGQQLRKYFRAQHKRVEYQLRDLTGGGKSMALLAPYVSKDDSLSEIGAMPAAWFDKTAEQEKLVVWMTATIERLVSKNGGRALAEMGIAAAFDVSHPDVVFFVETLKNKFAADITDTTFKEIQRLLSHAYRDNLTWNEFAKTLKTKYSQFSKARSELAARTEMGRIVNGSSVQAWKQNDVTHIQWVSTRDSHVRDSHAFVDGQIIRIDSGDVFSNGLLAPHDSGAPASEVCNCRCAIRGIIHDDPTADLNADFSVDSDNGNGHKDSVVIANNMEWRDRLAALMEHNDGGVALDAMMTGWARNK